jgi:hypothetical protein
MRRNWSRRKRCRAASTKGTPLPRSQFGRTWKRYKDKVRYQPGAPGFPSKRMSLFDKLNTDFVVIVSLAGAIWLAMRLLMYALS